MTLVCLDPDDLHFIVTYDPDRERVASREGLRGVITPAKVDVMTPTEKAPRCEPRPGALQLSPEHRQSIPDEDDWAGGTHTTCLRCGQRVKFRVRATDVPPWARILPHRTDGTPCR